MVQILSSKWGPFVHRLPGTQLRALTVIARPAVLALVLISGDDDIRPIVLKLTSIIPLL